MSNYWQIEIEIANLNNPSSHLDQNMTSDGDDTALPFGETEDTRDIISQILFEYFPCEGVVLAEETFKEFKRISKSDKIKAFFSQLPNLDDVKKTILENISDTIDINLSVSQIEEKDWSEEWKKQWQPTKISQKIVICPTWREYNAKDKEIVINLNPGMAFGTGTHATTQLCVRAMEEFMPKNAELADIGCGSGILAICGIKLGAKKAVAIDNDPITIPIAIDNATLNNVDDKIKFFTATSNALLGNTYDFICANILHNVLDEIMGELKQLLKPNGQLVLSGILDEKKQIVLNAIERENLKLEKTLTEGNWVGLIVKNKRKRQKMNGKTAIIIPSRYGSTRLPAKALIEVNGKTIIQYVWEKASASKLADEVIIATDHPKIIEACQKFGANAMMTRIDHQCGSDRIAEVAQKRPDIDYIINVQGDEPLITPESIDACISALKNTADADVSTLLRVIKDADEINNPNIVKCVKNLQGYAMYFSRSAIPYKRNDVNHTYYGHLGIYGYKREALFKMTSLPQTSLEKTESLEQLRVLDNGMKIITSVVNDDAVGIDTIEDVERFKSKLL